MFNLLSRWYQRNFTDPEAIALIIIMLMLFLTIYFFHVILAPVFVAIVLAYLLEGPIGLLQRLGFARLWAVFVVFMLFIALVLVVLLLILPLAWQQLVSLFVGLPGIYDKLYAFAQTLPAHFPILLDMGSINPLIQNIHEKILALSDSLIQYSLSSLVGIVVLVIYLILVPVMLFFLLKDKPIILNFLVRWLPSERLLAKQVWQKMDRQISSYIRGKIIEIITVYLFTYLVFIIFGLKYGLLLSILVGLSVIIPYAGAVVVSIPVFLIAMVQYGITPECGWLLLCYLVVQGLDSNLLVPILYAGTVNLHPLVIILAILVFGGLWGIWGIFFAIPLASLIKILIEIWPQKSLTSDR